MLCTISAVDWPHADPGFVHDSRRSHLAGGLAIKQIAGIDSVQQKAVAGVALPIGPDRLVPQAAVRSGAGRHSAFTPGERTASPVKDPVGSGTASI